MKNSPTLSYRPDIDGLRAVAVFAVIINHLSEKILPGGFFGVDIFFVISGFLVCQIIHKQVESGTFVFREFYIRRVLRLIPALYVVVIITNIAGWLFYFPEQKLDLAKASAAAAIYLVNYYFYFTVDYFSQDTGLQPLLHLWSLSLEEQFYLIAPLLIFLFRSRLAILLMYSLIILCSFFIFWSVLNQDQPLAFYSVFTRLWEFFLGAIFGYFFGSKIASTRNPIYLILGVVGLGYSFFWLSKESVYTAYLVLIPVFSTCLIIFGNYKGAIFDHIISSRVMVFFGAISYSLYLVHQPVLAFLRFYFVELSLVTIFFGLAIIFLVSFSLHFGVEKKIRYVTGYRRKLCVSVLALATVAFTTLGVSKHYFRNDQGESNISSQVLDTFHLTPREQECFSIPNQNKPIEFGCPVLSGDRSFKYMIVGDSHALALLPAFEAASLELGTNGYFAGSNGCIPFLNVVTKRRDNHVVDCSNIQAQALEFVEQQGIKEIILIARWSIYYEGDYNGSNRVTFDVSNNSEVMSKGLFSTIETYHDLGVNVTVVNQIPQQRYDPKSVFARALRSEDPSSVISARSVAIDDVEELSSGYMKILEPRLSDIYFLDFTEIYCDDKCLIGAPDQSYYFDDDHLSITGSLMAKDLIESFLINRFDLH